MTDEPVEIIYSGDKARRVVIFRRPSGTYGYREERHYKNDLAKTEGWARLGGRACYYDNVEIAKREVVQNIVWLAKPTKG